MMTQAAVLEPKTADEGEFSESATEGDDAAQQINVIEVGEDQQPKLIGNPLLTLVGGKRQVRIRGHSRPVSSIR